MEIPVKYLGDKGTLSIRYATDFTGTNANNNNFKISFNSTNAIGGTSVFQRFSSAGLFIYGLRRIDSLSYTSHITTPLTITGAESSFTNSSGTSVTYTYDSQVNKFIIMTGTTSTTTADIITLKSVFIDIMPCFS